MVASWPPSVSPACPGHILQVDKDFELLVRLKKLILCFQFQNYLKNFRLSLKSPIVSQVGKENFGNPLLLYWVAGPLGAPVTDCAYTSPILRRSRATQLAHSISQPLSPHTPVSAGKSHTGQCHTQRRYSGHDLCVPKHILLNYSSRSFLKW